MSARCSTRTTSLPKSILYAQRPNCRVFSRLSSPKLQRSLARKATMTNASDNDGQKPTTVVPLDIQLSAEKHLLVISGPNAGGKSVCLKTVGLLQYMLQCGLSIPVGDRSATGTFQHIMIDIGDEQSIENDLSTSQRAHTHPHRRVRYWHRTADWRSHRRIGTQAILAEEGMGGHHHPLSEPQTLCREPPRGRQRRHALRPSRDETSVPARHR